MVKEVFKRLDRVRKLYTHDGTSRAGKPTGEILIVFDAYKHRPSTTLTPRDDQVVILSDGTWEFSWNLQKEK